jgi:hypothetical protein
LVDGNSAALWEARAHHIRDVHVGYVLGDTKDFACRNQDTLDAEFKIHQRQSLYLVEIKQVEQDYKLLNAIRVKIPYI